MSVADPGSSAWKGHAFTLLLVGVFALVCAFFFVLGFTLGRSQSEDSAPTASPEAVREPEASGDRDDVSPSPGARPQEGVAVRPASLAGQAASPDPGAAVVLQVAALLDEAQAEVLCHRLLDLGLQAFVLGPDQREAAPLHRVQVGPFSDGGEAERARALLRAEGYEPIVAD